MAISKRILISYIVIAHQEQPNSMPPGRMNMHITLLHMLYSAGCLTHTKSYTYQKVIVIDSNCKPQASWIGMPVSALTEKRFMRVL